MSRADVNGITLAYDDEGSGDTLVLVHGHPFNRSMWRPQVEHFSGAGRRVIAADLRGYGGSTVAPGITTLETFARDIAALLDHLEVDMVVLGGLSMGGQIVLEFQRLFPHRLRGLLLADTSAPAETEKGRRLRHEMADRLLREGMAPYAAEVLPSMITGQTIRRHPDVAQRVLAMMRDTSPEGASAALRGRAERPDYVEMLPRIAVPALILVGAEDALTPLSDAQCIYEAIPGATLAVIDAAGHMPNLEQPTEFNGALQRFLNPLPSAPLT